MENVKGFYNILWTNQKSYDIITTILQILLVRSSIWSLTQRCSHLKNRPIKLLSIPYFKDGGALKWKKEHLYARIVARISFSQLESKNSTKKRDSITNQKDVKNAETRKRPKKEAITGNDFTKTTKPAKRQVFWFIQLARRSLRYPIARHRQWFPVQSVTSLCPYLSAVS